MLRHALIVSVALGVGLVAPADAQRISLSPDIGVYVPTTRLMDAATSGNLTGLMEQQISLSVGGKLDLWFSNRLGIQGTGSYAPSQLQFSASGSNSTQDANIFLGSGRLMVYVIPPTSPISFLLNGGVGMVSRSGEAYADSPDKMDLSGTFGAAVGLHLGSLFSLRITGESYIYNPDFIAQAIGESLTQNDFNLSLGLGIPLLGLGSSSGN